MIVFLKGILVLKTPAWIEMDVNGVGFGAAIPLSTYDDLPEPGQNITLYTYLHVREDALSLYAFRTSSEKEMFCLLLTVSGIGPKIALTALSALSEKDIHNAIVMEDAKRLSSIPGIGKKTAERIILDLKDKIQKKIRQHPIRTSPKDSDQQLQMEDDAVSALVTLGYDYPVSSRIIQKCLEEKQTRWTTETLLRNALNTLMTKK
ncbi:MAG: Holliday junction branch migration protein RuvA [Candidatus Aureabacteria bacterium]|nr:Holliday junction branch migration protein RuvA [Candidatus Auribacterota bacterium]